VSAALTVAGLSVAFGGVKAVDALSFSVQAGTIKGVIGPNGAGKTTLFNAISGFVAPQAGRVGLADRDVTGLPPQARAALGLARTFQNLQLFARMTVLENVMVGAHARLASGWLAGLFGLARREAEEAEALAHVQLSRLGLDAHAARRAGDLGFAEGKLVEIARALAASPQLLLLDEPIAGVPLHDQRRIAEVIRDVHAGGTTILLVEHNMRVVMGLCDEILVLHHGARLAEGPPAQVAHDPDVIAAYLGTAAHA